MASLLAVISAWTIVELGAQSGVDVPLRGDAPAPRATCGTTRARDLDRPIEPLALPNGLPDGEPFTFDQDPPLVPADYGGSITLRRFSVVGDFATAQFVRNDPDNPDGRTETWERLTSRSVNGQLVSVFEPRWDASELAKTLTRQGFGFDRPYVYWGSFQVPNSSAKRYVYLRMAIHGIPRATVVRLNDSAQYASDVVNIVVPTFDDRRVSNGSTGFDFAFATQIFYQHFADAYDVLAFTPAPTPVADFGAFHSNVSNAVSGLNLPLFDRSLVYGSRGVLQGVEVYTDASATRFDDTNHEMAHQWLSHFDWQRIAGISRAGHSPAGHSPLWTGGETLIGAVLYGDRRVTGSATYTIERTPAPVHFHPLELYAMGLVPSTDVPDFAVFADQGQFGTETSASPSPGTSVVGETRPVRIADVIREHGIRQGPVPSTWRRATVLVSRDRLATQDEMDYWNFFAQRLADRSRNGRATRENYVPFHRAVQDRITLTSAIQPIAQAPLPQEADTDTPSFGVNDVRGVTFTSPVPTRFVSGQPVTISGRVTATDQSEFSVIQFGFWKIDATTPVRFPATVARNGDFTITVRFSDGDKGQYSLSTYLYWPNSGSQYPRTSLSTITVE